MTPEEIQSWKPFLKRIPLFKDLSAEDLDKVASLLRPLSLPRGATLFHQGDRADSFFIITSGHIELISERQNRQTVTGYLGRGDTLGELALLTGEPRAWTARLDATSEFLVLSKRDFATVLRKNPAILLQLSRTLSSRLLHETRGRAELPKSQPKILTVMTAAGQPRRTLFTMAFALSLVEQTRRRVLLVDMSAKPGDLAGAFGVNGDPVTEEQLRRYDLRDSGPLKKFVQVHPSGLGVITLPSNTLSGKLYRSIFLLMNLLRDHSDFAVVLLPSRIGEVEKAVLYEADRWIVAGSPDYADAFSRLQRDLAGYVPEPARMLEAWIGDQPPVELSPIPGREWVRVPWPAEIDSHLKRGDAPFDVLSRQRRTRECIEGLARRFAHLRVGLALGTGAALGYSLIGVLKCFERHHLPIDLIAGTSIGSLMGGFRALGLSPDELEEIASGVDRAWVYENLFWDMTVPRSGFFAGTTLLRFLRSYFGDKDFGDLEIPFACVATDIETGEEIVFKEGRVAEAVRASCGIPLIFQPFPYQGRFLVDGGLVDPVPTKVVSQMGADILVSVNLTMPAGERKSALRSRRSERGQIQRLKEMTLPKALQSPNMFQVLFQLIYTMEYQIAQSRSELAHVNIHPDLSEFSWTELHRAKEIIDAGERVAEAVVPKIKAMLPYYADSCKVDIRESW